MEDILRQRFNYARIVPYKNYSPLSSWIPPKVKRERDPLGFDSLNGSYVEVYEEEITRDHTGIFFQIPDKTAKYKRKYFVGDGGKKYRLLNPPSPFKTKQVDLFSSQKMVEFDTQKERHIKRHFNNPFSSIQLMISERSIVKHGDKITFKSYHHTKSRGVNCIYFRKKSHSFSLTYNTVTGNFTTVTFDSNSSKKKKLFRTNSFSQLESFIVKYLGHTTYLGTTNEELKQQYADAVNSEIFTKTFISTLGLDCSDSNNDKEIFNAFIDKFVKGRKIKVPNHYRKLLLNYYPTEKFFRKNDRKLVSSITDMFGIKSNITNKIIHEFPKISMSALIGICQLFGEDYQKYIGNIKKSQFEINGKNGGYSRQGATYKQEILERDKISFQLTHKEKENMLGVLNTYPEGVSFDYVITMVDHLTMLFKLRQLVPIEFKSKTYNEFNREHSEFSKMAALIRKAFVNEFIFDEKMTKDVEQPIDINEVSEDRLNLIRTRFQPVILRREEEYSEEGSYVHHCVGGYANNDRSIIVSLRNLENGDRVTSEYNVKDGSCIQSKYYHNAPPPEYYKRALKILHSKIEYHAKKNRLKSIERKQVRTKINGVEVPLGFEFNPVQDENHIRQLVIM
jgi:hypothetical protein